MATNDRFRESISGGFKTSKPREHEIRTRLHAQRESVRTAAYNAGVSEAILEEALNLFDSTSSARAALEVIERAAAPEIRLPGVPELKGPHGF